MHIYEAKATSERLKDKLAKALGSRRYFIEDGEVVEIDNALDFFYRFNRYKRCHRRRN